MTVDSEAIFAVAAHTDADPQALEELCGSFATAWLDERRERSLFLARGAGRPLWVGRNEDGVFFASTKLALEVLESYLRIKLDKRELEEGTLLEVSGGREVVREAFEPNRAFQETPLPAVRTPKEGAFCLARLAVLAA
jgi:asparagine synthetase B (glutamine-hydrolysing)